MCSHTTGPNFRFQKHLHRSHVFWVGVYEHLYAHGWMCARACTRARAQVCVHVSLQVYSNCVQLCPRLGVHVYIRICLQGDAHMS